MAAIRPEIDLDAAVTFLRRHAGEAVDEVHVLAGGELSRAFAFRRGGQAFVLRVAVDLAGFERDRNAYQRFAGPDLPIPRVVEIGRFERGAYAISERLPGGRLADLQAEHLPAVLPSLVTALRALRQAEIGPRRGYGYVGPAGDADWPSWRAFLLSIRDDPPEGFWHGWHDLFDETFLERAIWEMLYERMAALVPACPEERRLIHGDFHPWNLLADARGLTGVLDWANLRYGDALYDLAVLEAWWPVAELVPLVCDDMRRTDDDLMHFDERRRCYRYWLGLDGLRFYAKTGQRAAYERTRDRLVGD